MSKLLAFIVMLSFLSIGSVCAEDSENIPHLIKSETPYYKDGRVGNYNGRVVETGLIGEVYYDFYYSDGSGKISGTKGNSFESSEPKSSNWQLGCTKDAMEDFVFCHAKLKDLTIIMFKDGNEVIRVGNEHYPDSSVAIRIGDDKPYKATADKHFSPRLSKKILNKLKTGVVITTRYKRWPYKHNIDRKWELFGFDEAYAYLKWAIAHIN